MPPKSATKKVKAEQESLSEWSDLSPSVNEKKPTKRKTKADKSQDVPASEEKKPARKRAKKDVLTEPETTEEGWTLHPPSLIYRYILSGDPFFVIGMLQDLKTCKSEWRLFGKVKIKT